MAAVARTSPSVPRARGGAVIDREALLGEAREDLLRSRYDQARQRYQELLQVDDCDVDALTGMTRVALAKGELDSGPAVS
jgi:hypothetical protein